MQNKIFLTIICFLSLTINSYAFEDQTIYALSDGTYLYKNTNYSLDKFPVENVLKDKRGGDENSPSVDSVVPISVDIFPVDNVDINNLRTLVRPLAVRFHHRGAKVNTRFLNSVIPYLFKKPEFFDKNK